MPPQSPKATIPKIPVAKPAIPEAALVATVEEEDVKPPFFSIETLKGWGSSVILHAVLLIVAATWYFAPKAKTQVVLNTRLAGSENGMDDGLTATGGLLSEFEMPKAESAPAPTPTAVASARPTLDLNALAVKPEGVTGSDRPTLGGGMANNNPGAGDGDGFGIARFGQGGEMVRGVAVKVGDPQFTLLWDNDSDLDLHVIEPGGKEIYWEKPKGKHGGELDVDNTKGFGPENIYWRKELENGEKEKGQGPPGEYKWFVVNWSGFGGIPKPTRWKVRIKHDGKVEVFNGKFKALNERSKMHTLHIDRPGGTGTGIASDTPTAR